MPARADRDGSAERLGEPDPAADTLEVFRLEGGGWRLVAGVAGAVTVRAEPFDSIEIDLGRIWAR